MSDNQNQSREAQLESHLREGNNRERYAALYRQHAGDQRGWRALSPLARALAVRANQTLSR